MEKTVLLKLIKHELLLLLKNNRIRWSVTVFIVLFLTIFYVRLQQFNEQSVNYRKALIQNEEEKKEAVNYSFIQTYAVFPPVLFSVYHEGEFQKYGHEISTHLFEIIYDTDPQHESKSKYFKENQTIDITFLILFFLSLFILLATYDAINGEKQTGTLRLLLTYEVRRIDIVLQKIIGAFLFVAVVFLIPYIASFLILQFTYSSYITISFIIQWLLYLIFTLLYILCFVMLGIGTSLLTTNTSRSLAYSVFLWALLVLILPIIYSYTINNNSTIKGKSDKLWKEMNTSAQQFYQEKEKQLAVNNTIQDFHYIYQRNEGPYNDARILSTIDVERKHVDDLKRFYRYAYPIQKEVEQKSIRAWYTTIESNEYHFCFFNPVAQFSTIAKNLSGNSTYDYVGFIKDVIRVRDQQIEQGVQQGWLLSRSYFAVIDTNLIIKKVDEIKDQNALINLIKNHSFTFMYPAIAHYEYKPTTVYKLIYQLLVPMLYMLLFCLAMFTIDIRLIRKYDVR